MTMGNRCSRNSLGHNARNAMRWIWASSLRYNKSKCGITHWNVYKWCFLTASISIFQFFNYFIRAPNTITAELHKSRCAWLFFLLINAVTRARAEKWTWIDWSIMQRSGKREFIDCGAGEMCSREVRMPEFSSSIAKPEMKLHSN